MFIPYPGSGSWFFAHPWSGSRLTLANHYTVNVRSKVNFFMSVVVSPLYQCWGSVTFWYCSGCGSGSFDPYLWGSDQRIRMRIWEGQNQTNTDLEQLHDRRSRIRSQIWSRIRYYWLRDPESNPGGQNIHIFRIRIPNTALYAFHYELRCYRSEWATTVSATVLRNRNYLLRFRFRLLTSSGSGSLDPKKHFIKNY
jgi:hypothetical protein